MCSITIIAEFLWKTNQQNERKPDMNDVLLWGEEELRQDHQLLGSVDSDLSYFESHIMLIIG